MVERGLRANVSQIAPKRRILPTRCRTAILDCLGGVINDLTADSKGGGNFTMGGLFHADEKGNRHALRREPENEWCRPQSG